MKRTVFVLCLIAVCANVNIAQTTLNLASGLNLPKDSVVSRRLIAGLTDFLNGIQTPNGDNPMIVVRDKAQTLDLMDEISGIQKSRKYKDDYFYKPYLLNVTRSADSSFQIQIAFIGIADNLAVPRATFNLTGYFSKDTTCRFSSPLRLNTSDWKVKRIGSVNIHFKRGLDLAAAGRYHSYVSQYDKRLGSTKTFTEYYCCADATEALRVLGVMYKSDYNGRTAISLSHSFHDTDIIVAGKTGGSPFDFDPHDLWHSRLRNVVPADKVNKSVDEGCAYLYGGSWGISWDTIYRKFIDTLGNKQQTDWQKLCDSPYVFYSDNGHSELLAGYVIHALIVQKIEKEKGFVAVLKLLKCGKQGPGNENYFDTLKMLTGVTKDGFNAEVWKLIRQENRRRKPVAY